MRIDVLLFIIVGALIVIGFMRQFGLLSPRGFVFVVAGAAGLVGWSVLSGARARRIQREIKAREADLKEKEVRLDELQKDFDASEAEVERVRQAIEAERNEFKLKLSDIETERTEGLAAARKKADAMSSFELLDTLSRPSEL